MEERIKQKGKGERDALFANNNNSIERYRVMTHDMSQKCQHNNILALVITRQCQTGVFGG